MAILVARCPRCGAERMTFDVVGSTQVETKYEWQRIYEAFSVCRRCHKSTVFVLAQDSYHSERLLNEFQPSRIDASLNEIFKIERFINIGDLHAAQPPDHVPEPVANAFREGAVSLVVENWNAAGTMFRLAIDLTTKPLLPEEPTEGLKRRTRRDLAPRLQWLFDNGRLPSDLRDLSHCVREDGNDGAHAGTLQREDAEDLLDFTTRLMERIFTLPGRLKEAEERRVKRREGKQ